MNKAAIVSKVYNYQTSFVPLKQTLSYAREIDPSIKMDDVRQRMEEHTKRKKQRPDPNAFVANGQHHEYHMDLMFM